MAKNVLITLTSTQIEENEKATTELITSGKYKEIDGGYEISYEESEATGFSGSVTSISAIGDKMVVMNRKGASNSQLIIERDCKHRCHYGTPYGDFMVGIEAKKISSSLDKNGGTLEFSYVLDINSSYISDFELVLRVENEDKKQ